MGWGSTLIVISLGFIHHVLAFPVQQDGSGGDGDWIKGEYLGAALSVAALFSSVTILLACVCCKRSGFKELSSVSSRVAGSTSTINHGGPREEFTMFPPAGISQLSISTGQINFEPLPDIRPRSGSSRREKRITDKTLPASFPSQVSSGLPTDEWFAEPHQNFPRNQLQYVKEIGKGWFGHVLEGRATGIFSDHTKGDSPVTSSLVPNAGSSRGQTPVAVKVLREDATPTEQMYFLHELRPYRDLTHPNVLKVLAQCLETEPFLILLQLCPKGDLKSVVREDKKLTDATLLRMTLDVASGLLHMHSNNFKHTDLAARNCVVDDDNTVKIGDYGYNIDFYKDEYYCAGEVALPLRWCAPETLKCTDTTIETKEVTKPANVWSFGVIMWEVASRGLMPYTNLDDDRVIQEVVIDQSVILEPPKALELHAEKIYNIMKLCWSAEPSRPAIDHIASLLSHLWENHSLTSHDASSLSDFELRWSQLQQQPSHDHSIIHGVNTADMRFESDFSLSVPASGHMGGTLSPSLQNLHGSVEDLDAKMAAKFGSAMPSWLGMEPGQPMDSLTREITDAILKLDDYLAGEKSEPSSSTQSSPEKDGVKFKVGKDSFVSHPPESKLVHASGLTMSGSGHPSLSRTLSEGEEEGFTMRLEQGEFTEMVRLKSQSVQDFMKLTVVDDGSDSDNASQKNSLAFEQVNKPLASEKSFSSEGNIREALRDVKFMGDLERLQAEHKYSIITEASRENPSSIEFRNQDFDLSGPLSSSEFIGDSEAGSTEKLASSVDSNNSNNFNDKQNSESDPFLGKVVSSRSIEEKNIKTHDAMSDEKEFVDTSSKVHNTLSASPDCVVSSREKKPVSLPDIVVHDSNLKPSTPSPPPTDTNIVIHEPTRKASTPNPLPQDSPVKVFHVSQPKEFRIVFSEERTSHADSKGKGNLQNQGESVIFSENIKDNKLIPVETESNQRLSVNSVEGSVWKQEPSCKEDKIVKFLNFVHDHPETQLTSTPLKRETSEESSQSQGSDEDKIVCETSSSSSYSDDSSMDSANSEEDDVSSDMVGSDPDNLGVKQRLVFTHQDNRRRESSCEDYSDESANEDYKPEEPEVPSYVPEQVVEGEDVVIGALDDYSLDLFKAVKSTSTVQTESKNSNGEECNIIPKSKTLDKESEANKAEDIEYNISQWDEFLGNELSEKRSESGEMFKSDSNNTLGLDSRSYSSKDILGSSFDPVDAGADSKVQKVDVDRQSNCNEKSVVDLSSTFEHDTCDEIQEVMLNGEANETQENTTRPNVDSDMFFNSDSNLSIDVDINTNIENALPCTNNSQLHVEETEHLKSMCIDESSLDESAVTTNLSHSAEFTELQKDTSGSLPKLLVVSSSLDKPTTDVLAVCKTPSDRPMSDVSEVYITPSETLTTDVSGVYKTPSDTLTTDVSEVCKTPSGGLTTDVSEVCKTSSDTLTTDVSEVCKTPSGGLTTDVSEVYKPSSDGPSLHVSCNRVEVDQTEPTPIITSSHAADISSDSFTYKREASVDNSSDMLDNCGITEFGINKNEELIEKIKHDAKQEPMNCESVRSNMLAPEMSKSGDDVVDHSLSAVTMTNTDSTNKVLHSNYLGEVTAKSTESVQFSHESNIENSKSVSSGKPTTINLKDEGGTEIHSDLIIGDEDDLSPSAYQGKLKGDDCWSSQESQDSAVENDEAENGEFWQQQMMAWQQAAFQTRQLLQQATGSESDAALASLKGSQEDLEASPRSDTSSTKSPYSSSDMLNLDDEGTYVSYNTTDDEEVLGYKPEDISALRAELNLKLGGLLDDRDQIEPEDADDPISSDRENVVINYRGVGTSTLSPIKEESFLDEEESPVKKLIIRNDDKHEFNLSESIEFEESLSSNSTAVCIENGNATFVVNEAVNNVIVSDQLLSLSEFAFSDDLDSVSASNEADQVNDNFNCTSVSGQETKTTSQIILDNKQDETSLENTHNSLILEDLEDENGPSSIQIYDAGDNLDADDVLVVDTITNEATIVDGGIPRSHLAFITDEEELSPSEVQPFVYDESDDVAPESIPSVGGSRFDEVRHREQFLSNNPSWDNRPTNVNEDYCGDLESKPEGGLVNCLVTSEEKLSAIEESGKSSIELESPQGIQVPHYHSYFTSALSTISHPNASLEEPPLYEPVEHISLPYDVNYPAAGEHLQSLEEVKEKEEDEESKVSKETEDVKDFGDADAPIKLNFLGRLYSDDSEGKEEDKQPKSHNAREATLLSDSEEESIPQKPVERPKTPEPEDLNQMTSAEFLASEKYQITENEDIEEQIEIEGGYQEDSDDEDGVALTPGKLANVEFRMIQDSRYTPDWESDSDSDGESSSTSGEFMWKQEEKETEEKEEEEEKDKPGEEFQQSNIILDVIDEEGEDEEEAREGDVDDDNCSDDSESGEEEFTPSKWNRDLTPSHSLLKSPQNRSSLKKSVRWKRQRHHRVYEYPPEPRSWEPTPTESHQRRSWGRSSLDYLSLADWELGADEFIADDNNDMDDYVYRKPIRPAPPPPIYSLGSISYDDTTEGYVIDNGEFFIRSSSSPFTFTSSSFSASDFFPGSTFYSGQDNTDLSDPLADDFTNALSESCAEPELLQPNENSPNIAQMNKYIISDDVEQSSPTNTGLGQLRHTRDKLRLEIPTISVASDATKGAAAFTLDNEGSLYGKYNGQETSSSLHLTRTEPEVSEV